MLYQNNEHWHGEAASADVASVVAAVATFSAGATVAPGAAVASAVAAGTTKQLTFFYFLFLWWPEIFIQAGYVIVYADNGEISRDVNARLNFERLRTI
jgi:hypothetical protein